MTLAVALPVAIGALAAGAAAPAGAIVAVEYRAGITQGVGFATGGNLGAIVAGPDGNLWFTEAPGRIGRITPAGEVTEFGGFARMDGIAAGPGGAVWFGQRPTDGPVRIGRIGVDGDGRASYPVTDDLNAVLGSLTAGPDGAVWFTLAGRFPGDGAIGRLTTAGDATLFRPRYQPPSVPWEITTDADGRLWYTEPGYGFSGTRQDASFRGIARITTGGATTAFAVRSPLRPAISPSSPAAGPDGKLWFVDASMSGGKAAIGRIAADGSGRLFELQLPPGVRIGTLASGRDGNLWFSAGRGWIGRMTTKGSVSLFRTPSRARAAGGLAAGPDGNLWMTDETGGVVKVTPPRGVCVVPRVAGLAFARAEQRLRGAGCRVGRVDAPPHARRAGLTVIRQSPSAGKRLPAESSVALTLR